jgi:lipoate-protein ligase B
MTSMPFDADLIGPAVEVHLLGSLDFDRCLELQQQLIHRAGSRQDGQICVLLCEHPKIITIGRAGTAADVNKEAGLIRRGQVPVRWVKRGGGTMVHAPGQLAVYPIVPLRWHGFSVGEYLDLLEAAVISALRRLGQPAERLAGRPGIWGRTGQLALLGVAVRDWITWQGAFINVCPAMGLFGLVNSGQHGVNRMSSLAAERNRPAKMTSVRAELVTQLTEAFGCSRYHLHTGHPLLRKRRATQR